MDTLLYKNYCFNETKQSINCNKMGCTPTENHYSMGPIIAYMSWLQKHKDHGCVMSIHGHDGTPVKNNSF